MRDHKELFLFGRAVPSKADENAFIERVIDAANNRNRNGSKINKAIASVPANDIRQIVVGQNSIGFLFSNNRIARLDFEIVENVITETKSPATALAPSSTTSGVETGSVSAVQPSGSGLSAGNGGSGSSQQPSTGFASSTAANRTAKIRRMMIAARRPGAICGRTGVIVDRARATLPASSIPEELIAQAQVVLQGKSREVIVRELQRTNLNVNEAVNNLLSRDDDEDDLDEAGEYLHEELLSLLDAGLRGEGGAAVIDSDSLYGGSEGYDYLITQDRRRAEHKSKERKAEITAPTEITQENFKFADELQYWHDTKGEDFPAGVKSFTKIAATYTSLFAIADNGKVYTWDWKSERPSNKPHSISDKLAKEDADEKISDFEATPWRVAVLTNKNRVASFVDEYCGESLCTAFYTGFIELPSGLNVNRLLVCPLYAAVLTSNNKIFWWGVYPFVDRMQMFENVKKKSRDDLSAKTITIGSEVRTRSIPIYASGSVCVNFSSGVPQIGVLMEGAWTLTETCRFRVFSPDQYAIYTKERLSQPPDSVTSIDLTRRKRAAPSDSSSAPSTSAQYKEEAWSLRNITFFYEEPVCDTAIVKIIDGSFVGIVYKSAIEQNEKENNGVVDESQLLKSIRLLRKDDLTVVPSTTKQPRSPQVHQRKLTEIKIPRRVSRILSAVIENNCFRLLVEKTNGNVSIITTNSSGSETNEQHLSVDPSVLTQSPLHEKSLLALENSGDQDMLFLRDAAGSLVPLIPDSSNGFRESQFIGFAPTKHLSFGIRYSTDNSSSLFTSNPVLDTKLLLRKNESAKTANRVLLLAALVAPEPRTTEPKIDSLIQNILYCDLKKVTQILQELEEVADEDERRFQILKSFTDGNRNIFHTAVMNAFSATNRDQGDDYTGVKIDESGAITVEGGSADSSDKKDSEQFSTTEADAVSMKFDQRWKEMISSDQSLSRIMGSSPSSSNKQSSKKEKEQQPMEEEIRRELSSCFPLSARQRQKNAILIVSALASSKAVQPYFLELMRQRDLHGHTPFYNAVQTRAYSAALLMWTKLCALERESSLETLSNLAFSGSGNDSVLFLLCYNDNCSFSWTGEEHINQDIFECKTCDLIGSLCCCTECAFTCHRDHDCKLKRTSPTAYCDCWEKCGCKSLVSGNSIQRENLLNVLLQNTDLITLLNNRSEHLLLFLARTVGRQLVEQENFPRRSKIRSGQAPPTSNSNNLTVPEHNLEPPKFAVTALHSLLGRWAPIKSLLQVGVKEKNLNTPIDETVFNLSQQSGASHLDKFVFTLLARCPESALDAFLNTLVREANKTGIDRDSDIDELISRFVRSVIRLFSFLCISSQLAMSTTLAAISNMLGGEIGDSNTPQKYQLATSVPPPTTTSSSKNPIPSYRTITVSGVLSLVRTSLPISFSGSTSKENKKKQINNFVLKCRRVFQILITHSLTELLNASDALIAPVRLGVAKQGIAIHRCTSSTDPLDYIEKYLHAENDYSSARNSKHKRNRFRNPPPTDEENRGSDGSDSDDDTSDHRRQTTTNFVSNIDIAENVADSAINAAFRDAGIQQNVNEDNNDLSEDSISASDAEEDQPDFDQDQANDLGSEGSDEHEHYNEEQEHYGFRIDEEDVLDESEQEEYSDDYEDHESAEDIYEQNEQPPFDEVSQQAQSGRQRSKHPRRHRRSTANQSDQPANIEEAMDQDDTGTINVGQNSEQATRNTASNQNQPDSNQNATSAPAANNESSATGSQETASRSQPRTISTFRNLFTSDSSSPNRTTHAVAGQNPYTTQSPSIGWAVRRVRQNEPTTTEPSNPATATERNPISAENNNAEATALGVSSRHSKSKHHYGSNENDVFQTKIQLAASFSLMLKVIDELLLRLIQHEQYSKQTYTGIPQLLELKDIETVTTNFKNAINDRITITWEWFAKIMDKLEVMLRFGNALLKSPVGSEISPDATQSAASLNQSRKRKKAERKEEQHSSGSSKRDFFSYFMSLMRSHTYEQGDDLPYFDSTPYRHIAMMAEAYLFHINIAELIDNKLKILLTGEEAIPPPPIETLDEIPPKEIRRFYKRSSSISYPFITSAESQNAFKYSAAESIPLAMRSALLKPESDKSELFALPTVERTHSEHIKLAREHGFKEPSKMSIAENPLKCGEIMRGVVHEEPMQIDLAKFDESESDFDKCDLETLLGIKVNSTRLALTKTLGRWGNAMSYLVKAFNEDIIEYSGNDSSNSILLAEMGGFDFKFMQFKAKMEKFNNGLSKDLNFSQLTRDKHNLITEVFVYLNTQYSRRTTTSSSNIDLNNTPPLAANRLKATFANEPGEGSGVVRSFFTAFAEAIMEMEYLPKEDSSASFNQSSSSSSRTSFQRNVETSSQDAKQAENLPLFFRTRFGFLTPIPGNSTTRKNAFRNVGRIIGISLQQMEILPLPLCRHVLKFILGRHISWYDLVFFDPDMFDSLRSIVYDEKTGNVHDNEFYENLGLNFVIDVPPEEGGGVVELKPGGDKIDVNKENVLEYVYLLVQKRLLADHVPALESIRQGVFDVIPADSLATLSSEDLRLILCGTEQVSIRLLESFTSFLDESGRSEMIQTIKKWFFDVINKFTDKEKQDLLFFWTGSPSLPPTEEAFTPLPTVMLRPEDDQHLVTANTCISRLYLPIYSSKKILRTKLLMAIKCKDFGFV